MNKLTIKSILSIYGVAVDSLCLVRHGNKEIQVVDVYKDNPVKFNVYSCWQAPGKFGDSRYVAMFAPGRGTSAIFLGVWEVCGITLNKDLNDSDVDTLMHFLPEMKDWVKNHDRYHLKEFEPTKELSLRLIIEWGGATVAWVQRKDKNVLEIKPADCIDEFLSYDAIRVNYLDLKRAINNKKSNPSWFNALSTVNGIYLIKDLSTGKQYVGSAYGENGIWGRWKSYTESGHGGNLQLKELDPLNFEFSILEILTFTMSPENVIARENRWKECLGTRQFGLNCN
ncbi:TPA: GIY-YIG nuclease family protein [Aeromonas sobria]|nr:GIY-YIG nuclease family protein [Aeromonas sobria]